MSYKLEQSNRKGKRYKITTPDGKSIHFGSDQHENFTMHGDKTRRKRYISRHKKREDWTKKGINSAGFYSKHLLWNKDTLEDSIKATEKKFKIKIET